MPLDAAKRAIYVPHCLIYVTRAHEFDLCRAIKCADQYLQLAPKRIGAQWKMPGCQAARLARIFEDIEFPNNCSGHCCSQRCVWAISQPITDLAPPSLRNLHSRLANCSFCALEYLLMHLRKRIYINIWGRSSGMQRRRHCREHICQL